jgi:hypothetical protein
VSLPQESASIRQTTKLNSLTIISYGRPVYRRHAIPAARTS